MPGIERCLFFPAYDNFSAVNGRLYTGGALGMRRMTTLDNILSLKQNHLPKVSVIIPARNGAALTSILALDYADLENIAINVPGGEHIISWIK